MASGAGLKARLGGRKDLVAGAGLVIAGWLVILVINRWHVGPPVVFLCMAWLAVLLCGRSLWGSAQAAAGEGTGPDEAGFELSDGRVAELEKEKRALLKAIKEVEFDREMGKMSEEDAAEISRVYRARAIDIIKELEGDEGGKPTGQGAIDREIEREVRARLALAGVAERKVKAARSVAPAGASAAVASVETTADSAPGSAKDPRAGSKKAAARAAAGSKPPDDKPAEDRPGEAAADDDHDDDDDDDDDDEPGADAAASSEGDAESEDGAGSKSATGRTAAMQEREDA